MGPPGTKIFIGNLPDEADVDSLRTLFETVGKIAEIDVIKNYGFVHYTNEDDAKKAVEELNDSDFEGKTIKVEQSRSTVRHKPGMGNMTECYRCGKSGHWSKDCRGRGRGRGRGGDRGPYRDPYDDYYPDPYYQRRYLPPPPAYERYSPYDPYERRRLALARDPYYLERERDYYDRLAAREAYYDYYARRAYAAESAGVRAPLRDPLRDPAYAAESAGVRAPLRDPYAPPPRSEPVVSRSRVPGPY